MWYDARAIPFADFAVFKKSFVSEFYSIEARMSAKSDWESRRFRIQDRVCAGLFRGPSKHGKVLFDIDAGI